MEAYRGQELEDFKAARGSDRIKALSEPMQRARSANLIPYAHVNCFVLHTCGLGDTDVVKGFRTPQQVTAKDPTLARSETEESFLEAHASTYIYIYEYIDGPSLQNFQCYSNTVAMVSSECSVS